MFCTRCGSPVTADDQSCPTCGGNLLLPGSVGYDDETPTTGGPSAARPRDARTGPRDAGGLGSTRVMPAVGGHDDPDATRVNPRVPPQETPRAPRPATSNLPDDWFRSGTPVPPPPPPPTWSDAPQPPMVEPPPGEPAPRTQRRYHERMSTAVVVLLALIPVVAIAVLVWQLMQWGGINLVSPAARTTSGASGGAPVPSGAAAPSGATSATSQPQSPSHSTAPSSASPSQPPSSTVPANASQCSATVYAGPGTSCPFAQVVAAKVPAHPKPVFEVKAKSPVTHKDYTMTCTSGTLVECRGGNNAAVYVVTG